MLIAVERLLVRVRQVPSRADELIALRRRVRDERAARPTDGESQVARELRVLKGEVSRALADVDACGTCARGKRAPRGVFAGGDCCSGVTEDLFSDDEVAALVQAGTRPHHLRPPRTTHAGCAFRGATGCTLAVEDRPERCVHYVCHVLRRELRADGELAAIDEMLGRLKALMDRFTELRRVRLDDEILAPLEELARQRQPR